MKKLLAVCAFLALCGAAMAYDVTTAFKGTVDVKFDWINFSQDDSDYENCNDWYNYAIKYDAYLVLCYDVVLCPVCPFEIEETHLWLSNKKSGTVFYAYNDGEESFGGIEDVEGFCFGNGAVGVNFVTVLPYPNLEKMVWNGPNGETDEDWTPIFLTSEPINVVLSGSRQKASQGREILNLDGGFAVANIEENPDTVEYSDNDIKIRSECYDASVLDEEALTSLGYYDTSETIFATVSFKRDSTKVKADPYCPECGGDCDGLVLATYEKVFKSAKKQNWFSILGENLVESYIHQ